MLQLLGLSLLLLGSFGCMDCTFICPAKCVLPVQNRTETCSNISGECLHGCQLGYAGLNCSVECPQNCMSSNISGVEICNATLKECLFGCKNGFYGARCEKQCSSFNRNCKRCSSKNESSVVCDECKINFYRNHGKCLACNYWCVLDTNLYLPTCRENDGYCNFGCKSSRYGNTCGLRCSSTCNNSCHRDTGICEGGGCKYPSYCGPTCDLSCSVGCLSQNCNQSCTCILGCIPKKWGEKCKKSCNTNCNKPPDSSSNICDKSNGSCLYSCNNDNFWGSQCEKSCSTHCVGEICDQYTGKCTLGCKSKEVYGVRCNMACNENCVKGTCERINGYCDSGCLAGNYGDRCDLECRRYCVSDTCGRMDGHCDIGCEVGWHGDQCEIKCNTNCLDRKCERRGGYCSIGCVTGWYGDQCSLPCSSRCWNLVCNRNDGKCTEGSFDWIQTTSSGKEDTNVNSILVAAVVSGWLFTFVLCAVLTVIAIKRYQICSGCKGKKEAKDEQQDESNSGQHEYMTLQHETGYTNTANNYEVLNPQKEDRAKPQNTDSSYVNLEKSQL